MIASIIEPLRLPEILSYFRPPLNEEDTKITQLLRTRGSFAGSSWREVILDEPRIGYNSLR